MIAASRGDTGEARRLIEAGAEVNAADIFGNTALLYAARGGHADVVQLLLRNGADIRIKNKQGDGCLDAAKIRAHEKVLTILRTAELMLSIRAGETARAKELIDSGVEVDLQLADGWTPLMVAAFDDQFEVVNILLNRGANAALKNSKGLTAEIIAERKRHSRVIEVLRAARLQTARSDQAHSSVEAEVLNLDHAPPSLSEPKVIN